MTSSKNEQLLQILRKEKEELSELNHEMTRALHERETAASNAEEKSQGKLKLGERLADHVASFGGSWTFLMLFGSVLLGWVLLNSLLILRHPFDPYPYIFLNLILSALATLQAPIILMSQNRLEARDRQRDENDYRINLKTEIEVGVINDKLDRLVSHQWQRLLEIQELQMTILEDLSSKAPAEKTTP